MFQAVSFLLFYSNAKKKALSGSQKKRRNGRNNKQRPFDANTETKENQYLHNETEKNMLAYRESENLPIEECSPSRYEASIEKPTLRAWLR